MRIILLITFSFYIIIFTHCISDKDATVGKTVHINLAEATPVNFAEYCDSINYIPLGTGDVLISDITRLKMSNKYVVILEQLSIDRTFHTFTKQGHPIGRIQAKSEGPGKYFKVDDFWINDETGTIDLLDGIQEKIIHYSLTGEFKGEEFLPGNFFQFVKLSPKEYLFYNWKNPVDNQYSHLYHIKDEVIEHTFLEFSPIENIPTFVSKTFSNSAQRKSYLFAHPFDPNIYDISMDPVNVSVKYHIDMQGRFADSDWKNRFLEKDAMGQVEMRNNSGKTFMYDWVDYIGKFTAFTFPNYTDKKLYICMIDNNDMENTKLYNFEPDFSNTFDLGPTPHRYHGTVGNKIVFTMEAFDLTNHFSNYDIENYSGQDETKANFLTAQKLFSTIDPTRSNPILMVYHLKEEYQYIE